MNKVDVEGYRHIRGHDPERAVRGAWLEGPVRPLCRLIAVRYSSHKAQGRHLYHHEFSDNVWLGVADKTGVEQAPAVFGPLSALGNVSHFVVEHNGEARRMVAPALLICADGLQLQNSPVIIVSPYGTAPRVAIIHQDDRGALIPRIEDRGIVK